jgi:hypothetical protein
VREGEEREKEFAAAAAASKEGSSAKASSSPVEDYLSRFRSSVSNEPLKYGSWWHKVGSTFSCTTDELRSQSDTQRFVVINSARDAKLVELDLDQGGIEHYSDVSKEKLVPGHWYHNARLKKDITDLELAILSPSEKRGYQLITTASDVANVVSSHSNPALSTPSSSTISPSIVKPNLITSRSAAVAAATPHSEATLSSATRGVVSKTTATQTTGRTTSAGAGPTVGAGKEMGGKGKPRITYRSDISGTVLTGRWAHNAMDGLDVTLAELEGLPAKEKAKYKVVGSTEDILAEEIALQNPRRKLTIRERRSQWGSGTTARA